MRLTQGLVRREQEKFSSAIDPVKLFGAESVLGNFARQFRLSGCLDALARDIKEGYGLEGGSARAEPICIRGPAATQGRDDASAGDDDSAWGGRRLGRLEQHSGLR